MAKISDPEVKGVPQQLNEFIDDVRNIINFGTFQFPYVSTVPTFLADTGRVVIYQSGTAGRLYVRVPKAWDIAASWVATT